MLPRVLEPEAMDTPEEAAEYDAMDHAAVNARFVADFLAAHGPCRGGTILDVGTGTALIPIALCRADARAKVLGIDLAPSMIARAAINIAEAGLSDRIGLELADAKGLAYDSGAFEAVVSNSIVHHIPEPGRVLNELPREVASGGTLMVRDLCRPDSLDAVAALVDAYAGGGSDSAQALFEASLHAALTLDEIRSIVRGLGYPEEGVSMTSDRHWTWIWRRPSDDHGNTPD